MNIIKVPLTELLLCEKALENALNQLLKKEKKNGEGTYLSNFFFLGYKKMCWSGFMYPVTAETQWMMTKQAFSLLVLS